MMFSARDAAEDLVELRVAHPERIMVVLEIALLVEIEGQAVIDLDRREMRMEPVIAEPEDAREEPGRSLLVARGNDGVVEQDGHGCLLDMRSL